MPCVWCIQMGGEGMSDIGPCARCTKLRIRAFLSISGILLVLMWLQPAGVQAVARLMPSATVIATLIVCAAVIGFIVRQRKMRADL